MVQITEECEKEVDIEMNGDTDCEDPDPYDQVYVNIQTSHTCSSLKKIANGVVQKNSSTNLWGYVARKER
jgi:hypothetical protein